MPYRVVVDPQVCIGTSQCTEVAPQGYRMNEDHTLALAKTGATDEDLLLGAQSCPVFAITVFDENGKQIWP